MSDRLHQLSPSSLDAIGKTPVVQLQRVVPENCADVLIKLEYFNPTGSYKDRMALAMIREADYVVANDSGLAHAAGAMNKPMTILWKNTSLPKNANPGKRTNYKMCH